MNNVTEFLPFLVPLVISELALLAYTLYHILTHKSYKRGIRICDDELAEALKHLSERNRENLLMYYFLEMSDTEIAKRQNISRSGVFQNRHNSLELMKKILKEK